MYNLEKVYTAIEIGSQSLKIITCEVMNGKINVLKSDILNCPNAIKDYEIIHENYLAQLIYSYMEETFNSIRLRVQSVILLVPPIDVITKKEMTMPFKIYTSTGEFSKKDLSISLENSRKINPKFQNKEKIMTVPLSYSIDGLEYIEFPIGEKGRSISVNSVAHWMSPERLRAYTGFIYAAGLEIMEIVLSPYGFTYETCNPADKKSVLLNVDIGSNYTNVSLFISGILYKHERIPRGGCDLNELIAKHFGCDEDTAKMLKEDFMFLTKEENTTNEVIYARKTDDVIGVYEYNTFDLFRIGRNFFDLLTFEIKKVANSFEEHFKIPIDLVTISGGEIQILGSEQYFKEEFQNKNTNIYYPRTIGARNPSFTNVLGACYFVDIQNEKLQRKNYSIVPYMSKNIEKMNASIGKAISAGLKISRLGKNLVKLD